MAHQLVTAAEPPGAAVGAARHDTVVPPSVRLMDLGVSVQVGGTREGAGAGGVSAEVSCWSGDTGDGHEVLDRRHDGGVRRASDGAGWAGGIGTSAGGGGGEGVASVSVGWSGRTWVWVVMDECLEAVGGQVTFQIWDPLKRGSTFRIKTDQSTAPYSVSLSTKKKNSPGLSYSRFMHGAWTWLQTGHEIGSLICLFGRGVCVREYAEAIDSRVIHGEGEGEGECVSANAKRAGAGRRR